mmetsp:Transcript_5340/g.16554  ORF Transcript_5340/g.16554 Transcript_5340/m.16554 type:complete len:554 (+) Transcript_5340:1765-3426(+)
MLGGHGLRRLVDLRPAHAPDMAHGAVGRDQRGVPIARPRRPQLEQLGARDQGLVEAVGKDQRPCVAQLPLRRDDPPALVRRHGPGSRVVAAALAPPGRASGQEDDARVPREDLREVGHAEDVPVGEDEATLSGATIISRAVCDTEVRGNVHEDARPSGAVQHVDHLQGHESVQSHVLALQAEAPAPRGPEPGPHQVALADGVPQLRHRGLLVAVQRAPHCSDRARDEQGHVLLRGARQAGEAVAGDVDLVPAGMAAPAEVVVLARRALVPPAPDWTCPAAVTHHSLVHDPLVGSSGAARATISAVGPFVHDPVTCSSGAARVAMEPLRADATAQGRQDAQLRQGVAVRDELLDAEGRSSPLQGVEREPGQGPSAHAHDPRGVREQSVERLPDRPAQLAVEPPEAAQPHHLLREGPGGIGHLRVLEVHSMSSSEALVRDRVEDVAARRLLDAVQDHRPVRQALDQRAQVGPVRLVDALVRVVRRDRRQATPWVKVLEALLRIHRAEVRVVVHAKAVEQAVREVVVPPGPLLLLEHSREGGCIAELHVRGSCLSA